ncbi:MAG TPA: hypothetical protein VF706_01540 [Solirubrobacteraceae bacterium]
MDYISAQIDRARSLVEDLVDLAGELLRLEADIGRVHRRYVVGAFELLTEIEAQSLLAAAGNRSALPAIEGALGQLSRLRHEADQELDHYSGRD